MAEKPTAPRTMSGSKGMIWWEGEQLWEVKSFEAKVNINREDVNMAGDLVTDSKMTGWSGEFSMTTGKMFSTAQQRFAKAIKEGRDIRTKFIGAIQDPDAYGQERVVLYNCWISELPLLNFEGGSLIEEEISGGFTDYDFLNTVTRR
jgi:hypothetical protein